MIEKIIFSLFLITIIGSYGLSVIVIDYSSKLGVSRGLPILIIYMVGLVGLVTKGIVYSKNNKDKIFGKSMEAKT